MGELFPNQSYGQRIYKHKDLPIFVTDEFSFYRCVAFDDSFYGKTVSELHAGNLRQCSCANRYSDLFPYEKVSYWADSPKTARAEVKYHNKTNNLITFWAYDDATSFIPTTENTEPLFIVDGRQLGFTEILLKDEQCIPLSNKEKDIVKQIVEEKPDCLVYNSKQGKDDSVNYLFFEKGFKKLALREVKLRIQNGKSFNKATIYCAYSSDYTPWLKGYGESFEPIARRKMHEEYLNSEEYKYRKYWYDSKFGER